MSKLDSVKFEQFYKQFHRHIIDLIFNIHIIPKIFIRYVYI